MRQLFAVMCLCVAFISRASCLDLGPSSPRYYPVRTNLLDVVTLPEVASMIHGCNRQSLANACWDNSSVVVADVIAVSLVGIDGFDGNRICPLFPLSNLTSWYRVEFQVRKVVRGSFAIGRFWMPAMLCAGGGGLSNGAWSFYRGMTFKLLVQEIEDGHVVRKFLPSLPYEPYSDDVKVFGPSNIPQELSDAVWATAGDFVSSNKWGTAVLYGSHTLAFFDCNISDERGTSLLFPEFSTGCEIHVWTRAEGRPEYWSTSWFSDHLPEEGEHVILHCIQP